MTQTAPAVGSAWTRDWPDDLFVPSTEAAELESDDGRSFNVDCARWHGPLERADRLVLSRCRGPVLDIGCGPGRHVVALAERGMPALGIDRSPAAVEAAQGREAPVIHMSVFGPVPEPGWWGTALLLDGNVGIGGDVTRLLVRVSELLRPGGRVLVETSSPLARSDQARVRVRHRGGSGGWFPWAWTTPADLQRQAATTGMSTEEVFPAQDRWFAQLRTCGRTTSSGARSARIAVPSSWGVDDGD
jgi:SAM-dependent methyltransferase